MQFIINQQFSDGDDPDRIAKIFAEDILRAMDPHRNLQQRLNRINMSLIDIGWPGNLRSWAGRKLARLLPASSNANRL